MKMMSKSEFQMALINAASGLTFGPDIPRELQKEELLHQGWMHGLCSRDDQAEPVQGILNVMRQLHEEEWSHLQPTTWSILRANAAVQRAWECYKKVHRRVAAHEQ